MVGMMTTGMRADQPAPTTDLCTASMHCELQLPTAISQKPVDPARKPAHGKSQSPGIRGFAHLQRCFCDKPFKTGTPPAIARSLPSFGDLGTGRPGIPLFYTGLIEPTVLGALIQAGQGFPSLHPGPCAEREPSRFGDLGTGRPGIPSFIAPGDGSPAASGHRLRCRPTPLATNAPPPASATSPCHSTAPANSRPCR